jgi:hypothetical protein
MSGNIFESPAALASILDSIKLVLLLSPEDAKLFIAVYLPVLVSKDREAVFIAIDSFKHPSD